MRTPTEHELYHLGAIGQFYDPVKAHDYYEKHKKLKGRQKGSTLQPAGGTTPRQPEGFARANASRHESAKPRQRRELQARIQSLSAKLQKLETRIREMEHEASREDRKSKAKKERAAKERDKPKTAAEKAQAARDAAKYRDKNKQKLKSKSDQKTAKTGGSADKKKSGSKTHSLSDLKALATKVKGQIAVAKQKLAAL